ncbi:AAA family ATPase [Streptomyces sp. IB201691-2A2]|uniref:AAA family ATPase n=1 Tax=Streptomyces sp. IB201691-2A2 TaxID=2561920 RepID=UPI00117F0360|nr:AAA family ATPase [Streptomyces sp. IB201691-2A2]TRO62491.1 ATP-binding cassette domain-containing protein [Streptomyces sp. IB201691-2A2]
MQFKVISSIGALRTTHTAPGAYLITDSWDDWFTYSTLYALYYRDIDDQLHEIGHVKIGQFNMVSDQRSPSLPSAFSQLDTKFFSLGQDDSYYEQLNSLGDELRDEILRGLRDVAFDAHLFQQALKEDVMGRSLLRFVSQQTVTGQFRRLTGGGARLDRYSFTYALPGLSQVGEGVGLAFTVVPGSEPPTNIQVVIGRNGVGKTRLLNNMARALADPGAESEEVGSFEFTETAGGRGSFANLVSVTFSAFDPFEPISTPQNRTSGMRYSYIGLKRIKKSKDERLPPKDWTALASEFSTSVKACLQGARQMRWRRALKMLEADPIFNDAAVADLADSTMSEEELKTRAKDLFRNLSSGHKIVLLTITRLVETVEERSLVLLDEPEAHLHPPLLSAFTRALSDLLVNRNGVAVIATHSPVILQEVPKKCAWKLRRSGREVVAEQPSVETFGENVGILTREIFGLEVTRSGYHRVLGEAVSEGATYDEVVQRFSGQLGGEARALVRALVATRDSEESL